MPMQQLIVPEIFQILQREVAEFHPDLAKIVSTPMEIGEWLSHVCTYCEISVDGAYTEEDILNLCKILIDKLMRKRILILLP